MNNPFLIMTFLYIAMGVLAALDAALVSLSLLPAYSGLRWLRVHFITLGALTEFAFGILPIVVARRHRLPRTSVDYAASLRVLQSAVGTGVPVCVRLEAPLSEIIVSVRANR